MNNPRWLWFLISFADDPPLRTRNSCTGCTRTFGTPVCDADFQNAPMSVNTYKARTEHAQKFVYIYTYIYIYLYMCEPFTSPIVSCARLHCVYFCHKITSDGNQLIQNFIYTILFQTALRHELWRRKSKHGFVRSLPQFQSQISSLKMVGFSSNPHQIPIQPPSSPIEPPFFILHHADIINPPNTYAAKEQRRNRHLR